MIEEVIIEDQLRVRKITINRSEARNALNSNVRLKLGAAITDSPEDTRAIILRGAGGHFCSGQDLKEFASSSVSDFSVSRVLEDEYLPILEAIDRAKSPVIAAVEGACVGAGMSLALACDFVIAKQTAYFQLSFSSIGLSPDVGIAYVLPRLIGRQNATAMGLTAQKVFAPQAKQMGMVWDAVEDGQFEESLDQIVQHFAQSAPIAQSHTRQLMRNSFERDRQSNFALETDFQSKCAATEDFQEAVMAFIQKRPPSFKGK